MKKPTTQEKRARFRELHRQGCFVLPNPWDAGSARMLQHLGFSALASTSSGYAWTTGRPDYGLDRDEVLRHLRTLSEAVDLPINADFESGFAHEPEALAGNVRLAVETGIAGVSIEDRDGTPTGLYETAKSVERIRAARAAIDATGSQVILVARTERLLIEPKDVKTAIDKLVAFAAAGADCVYAPGVTKADIGAMVRAVAPMPVNMLMSRPGTSVRELADLGVRRISVGGALARVAITAAMKAAKSLAEGSFDGFAGVASHAEIDALFAGPPGQP